MRTIGDEELLRLLAEDCPFSDITTEGLAVSQTPARATLTARPEMVLCGIEEAARMFELCGASVRVRCKTGDFVAGGTLLLEAEGAAGGLHRVYKTAQTLMEILSGMATASRAIVAAVAGTGRTCRVACTRKHMPGIKRWALCAIEAGGAAPHRLSLSDYVLVFEEHLALLDSSRPLAEHFARLKASAPERRLAAEAASIEGALKLAAAGAEIVQVDKLAPEQVAMLSGELIKLNPRPLLAAAGGINASNAAAYAMAGADILVTSAPYYAPPRDVRVSIVRM